MPITPAGGVLAREVQDLAQQNPFLCYSCKRCTSGCPLAAYMDLTPAQVLRSLQLGQDERVLRSKTVWLCANCETCFTHCPQNIDLPRIMDALKTIGQRRGIRPTLPEVAQFYDLALQWMKLTGRVYELGVMGEYNLVRREPLRDASLGLRMLQAGKLKILPQFGRYVPPKEHREQPVADANRVAYFPGCSLHGTACEFDASAREVSAALGLHLVEPKNWVCCGTGAAHSKSHYLGVLQAMKSLAMIEGSGEERVTVPCAACYSRFKAALYDIRQDTSLRESVDRELGYRYRDRLQVSHILDTFSEQVGPERIAAAVRKPLKGLRVVSYYGCLYTRPAQITGAVHPENPTSMDAVLAALGAEVVPWSYKTACCGASLMLTQTDVALGLSQKILDKAKEVEADVVSVACSICHMNLDGRQPQIARAVGREYNLPVMYFTQLMGLAFGLEAKRLALEKHFIDPRPVLAGQGLI